ncbi:hypothetical protein IVB30_19765 [Bradyrhizobium sp. 200]|uniref:hypothetical protein n=1 Tax=Bradyrhizobium sp. 200 TaxID=2782665 RepID=UPI001FFEB3A3|nr:hypothetical protein [Bradyrhizobium sp. 200]UPJ53351.1 hypothetical protein IVB30_19765 [Bradyrhizobium sp. 200]
MESLIQHGLWPLAVVIIAIAGFGIFRGPIATLVNRTKKIGVGSTGVDFSEAGSVDRQQNIQKQSETEASSEIAKPHPLGPPSPTVGDIEQSVIARLAQLSEGDDDKIKRLIRAFSLADLHRDFEVTYRIIFGSQIDLLLAANAGSIDDATATAMFENLKSVYPNVHSGAAFETWLSYPLNAGLIKRKDGRIFSTQRGKEFMQYLVDVGLTAAKNNG